GARPAQLAASPGDRFGRAEGIVRHKRRRRSSRDGIVEKLLPTPGGDEEVSRRHASRVDVYACELRGAGARGDAAELVEDGNGNWDHAGILRPRSASRATSRSSKAIVRSASSCPRS